jgi:hypothetical protein
MFLWFDLDLADRNALFVLIGRVPEGFEKAHIGPGRFHELERPSPERCMEF